MSLVTYSDSEDNEDSDQASKKILMEHAESTSPNDHKRKRSQGDEQTRHTSRPPPLPSSLGNLYASSVRSSTNDNPSLHQGRRRQIPHVEGNWPSFVYLEWLPSSQHLSLVEDLIACIADENHDDDPDISSFQKEHCLQVRSFLRSDLGVLQPLHVSLSTPLILTTETKDTFEAALTRNVQQMNLSTFTTSPNNLRWVSNFDGTRHFLIIALKTPEHDQLQKLLSACNRTAASFGLPELYTQDTENDGKVGVMSDASLRDSKSVKTDTPVNSSLSNHSMFHISIAWSLQKTRTNQKVIEILRSKLEDIEITFDKVLVKIGNQVSTISLQEQMG